MNYFIQIDDETQGPLTADQIKRRLGEKGYRPTDLVRREDAVEWVTLESMEEFWEAARGEMPLANPMAGVSLALVVLSLGFLPLVRTPCSLVTSLLATLFGHLALRKISRSSRPIKGQQIAIFGQWLGFYLIFVSLATSMLFPTFSKVSEIGSQTRAVSNCRQIITAMRIYASDNNGAYPDSETLKAMTSNDAFRELFTGGVLNNEMIFGCPLSNDGNPDGKIGTSPDYVDALKPGENHWALTKGVTDSSEGSIPLVFEAPLVATWPPRWSSHYFESKDFGRTWPRGKIVIGTNDSSVRLLPTKSVGGGMAELDTPLGGVPLFQTTPDKKHEILNVAR